MRRSGHDLQLARGAEQCLRVPVQPEDDSILAPDDQQRGRTHVGEAGFSQIGSPAPRDDGPDRVAQLCGCDQSGSDSGARPEVAGRQAASG